MNFSDRSKKFLKPVIIMLAAIAAVLVNAPAADAKGNKASKERTSILTLYAGAG